MLIVECFVPGHPRPKGSMERRGGRMVQSSPESGTWQRRVAAAVRDDMVRRGTPMAPVGAPVAVTLAYVMPDTGGLGDIDKLERNILDAMTGVVYVDDVQVMAVEHVRVMMGDHASVSVGAPGVYIRALGVTAAGKLGIVDRSVMLARGAYLRSIGIDA